MFCSPSAPSFPFCLAVLVLVERLSIFVSTLLLSVLNDDDNGLALDALNGKKNKRAALAYALLVSRGSGKSKGTTTVEERDLYETIANLSYDGDIRHVFGAEGASRGAFSSLAENDRE